MTKIEHLQFLVLMVPTLLIIAAGAVSMADLTLPALIPESTAIAFVEPDFWVWDDWLSM
jgi:hypothetical protein